MRKMKMIWRGLRRLQNDSGSELVEFALASVILLALSFGVMDFSRAMYCYHYVTYAAQDGARYAMLRGADGGTGDCTTSAPYACIATNSNVQAYLTGQKFPLIDQKSLTINATWPGTTPDCVKNCSACSPSNSAGCLVQVKVTYNFSFILPFLPTGGLTLSGTSEKVIQ